MRPIRFAETRDGRALAWTRAGSGPPLVKAAAWLTHLEHDDASPLWSHYVAFFEERFDYLRYDERGCGMSDRDPGRLDVPAWTDDLERVVAAAEMPEPFILIAMSQGTGAAVAFAAKHPERVSHLVILGGYARGAHHRGMPEAAAMYDAMVEVFRLGFDDPNTAFREVFTRRFLPDGDPEKMGWFNDLCRRSTTPEVGAALLTARADMDVTDQLAQVRAPTLILHADGDGVAPLAEGRFLAQRIPGAEFIVLDSKNHILQPDEPAWADFRAALLDFTGASAGVEIDGLSPREREILDLICAAKSNKAIALELEMSEKTVRNHATRIFAKIGVASRQEAILKIAGGAR